MTKAIITNAAAALAATALVAALIFAPPHVHADRGLCHQHDAALHCHR